MIWFFFALVIIATRLQHKFVTDLKNGLVASIDTLNAEMRESFAGLNDRIRRLEAETHQERA